MRLLLHVRVDVAVLSIEVALVMTMIEVLCEFRGTTVDVLLLNQIERVMLAIAQIIAHIKTRLSYGNAHVSIGSRWRSTQEVMFV